jgi:cytochrome c-type biogenesis protein CcmE
MKAKPIKIAVTAAVLVTALLGLLYASLREGTEYYKHVDEVMVNPSAWQGKRLQLHGTVVEKSIEKRPGTLDYRFKVESNGHVVTATYTGVIPDNFKDGAEVVMKGTLGPNGFTVDARNGIMAKCPSKYEASTAGPSGR